MNAEWFAGRLKELREQVGISQKALAERVGLNVRQVSRLETGAQTATWPVVVALCQALGVGPDAFLQKPAVMLEPERGRPHKRTPEESASAGQASPKKPRGRPRKAAPPEPPPKRPRGRPPKAK